MKFLSSKKFLPVYWVGLSMLLLLANHSDPYYDFPMLFLIPVLIASWYSGRWWGLALGIGLPLVRYVLTVAVWEIPSTMVHPVGNASIRIVVLSCFAVLTDLLHRQQKQIKILEGFLPICHNCKRIRDAENQWQPIDVYLNEHAGTVFLQGLCTDCAREVGSQISKP